jgi:hypothetical protein
VLFLFFLASWFVDKWNLLRLYGSRGVPVTTEKMVESCMLEVFPMALGMHAVGGFVMMYHLRLQELGILDSQAAVDAHHLTGLNTTAHGERLDVLWNSPALLIEMLQCVPLVSNQPSLRAARRLTLAVCVLRPHGTTPFAHAPPLPLCRCVLLAVCVPAYMGREYYIQYAAQFGAQFWRNSAQLF